MATSDKQPARALPLLYLSSAHVSLALAFLFAGWWPASVAGFFYHSWLLALVHLITLGWISLSIVGVFYIVAPLALRARLSPRRLDYVAYACALVGLIGMVGHFWIQEYGGMAWSAGTVALGLVYMTVRIAGAVRRAAIQPAVKWHIVLACANFWIAATMGLLIAIDKVAHFLPGFVLANVFAHAHLAALGWATMMVIGVGYRMLPMTIPSKMPAGRSLCVSAVFLEIGVLGLFATLLLRSPLTIVFGLMTIAGLGAFAVHVAAMLWRPVPKPVGAHRIDFGLMHAAAAGIWLFAAIVLGVLLLVEPASPRMLHAAAAYGVFGLVGFLAQMIVAMESRLLPMVAWFWTYAKNDYRVAPPSPFSMRDRHLQAIVLVCWTAGVPALAAGMFLESASLVSLGAWPLFAAVALAAIDNAFVVAPGLRRAHVSEDRSAA
jgi:hypothetical protein